MDNEAYNKLITNNHLSGLLGQELIRDDLLPSILGSDYHEISYWAGKHLARTHQLANYDDLTTFFDQFKMGHLTLLKRSGNQIKWQLDGDVVTNRLDLFDDPDFFLEAGFIAQNCQTILNRQAESEIEKTNPSKGFVLITTFISKDKPIEGSNSTQPFKIINPSQQNSDSERS
ncbi:MAG: YslB family protein [Lentilactobacillus diolivorans]|jgi:hypothetical protein|uniref:YslB family protein n=1 Tax=Lentilactobacillus diolivorans TaxID=179838 RepID=UPI000FF455A8|nr:YslB family protein [Lentilactobacillus diolivorans]MCH4163468.1 YslB family protein [Lentilactobacillus diolivorans]MDH5104399.1 YslB family protein [Lentilactobacillus diolivorans]RRG04530.1 MAG: DUF2507 domain-containing protein [Lactobacillus sp.]